MDKIFILKRLKINFCEAKLIVRRTKEIPYKFKNEVFAICPERTKRVSPIGWEKKYYFLFLCFNSNL